MSTSWIKKYILPKEIDFISALHSHAMIIKKIIDDLEKCFISEDDTHCLAILDDQHQAKKIRDNNMKDLLNVFITPIDRESIYRVITELDWIAISMRHFVIEAKAYHVSKLDEDYAPMIIQLQLQAELLTAGFKTLKTDVVKTAESAKRVRDSYDILVDLHIQKMAHLATISNVKEQFIHRELLAQLKDISKRMRITANSLEDIIMKMA